MRMTAPPDVQIGAGRGKDAAPRRRLPECLDAVEKSSRRILMVRFSIRTLSPLHALRMLEEGPFRKIRNLVEPLI